MKNKTLIIRIACILVLIAIGAWMMVIGRGHTVYIDSKSIESNGQTINSPYKVECYHKGERFAKLYDGERGMVTNIGQKFKVTFVVTPEKGGEEVGYDVVLNLPYNLDGVVINSTALLNGLPSSEYMSEYVSLATEVEDEEDVTSEDDMGLSDEFSMDSME